MFGFSLGKLLLLLAIGAGAWFLWRRARSALTGRGQPPQRQQRQQARSSQPVTEAMVKCARCGAYVAESAGRCERADCPRPA